MRTRRTLSGGVGFVLLLAAVMAAPGILLAFTTIGGSLGIGTSGSGWQRDVRVWNNALDSQSNNNTTPDPNYPGALGAPLAIWKAAKGWASDNVLAAQNFDFDWQGVVTSIDSPDGNNVSFDATACSGGVLAYCETPISDGWNIVMCDNWTWSDGPGNPGSGQFDIQGVATHELGHALGLGHSTSSCGTCSSSATMCAAICSSGVSERTISADDAAGLGSIYGPIPANKPLITSLGGSLTTLNTLIINGSNFAPVVSVKFTAGTTQNTGTIPGVVTNVASTNGGTQISVVIPQTANDGNVIVWDPAAGLISNAFPIDVDYVPPPPPPPPVISSVAPASVQAFLGGGVTLTGSGFSGATQVSIGATVLTLPFGFAVASDTSITFNAPNAVTLGAVPVTVTAPGGVSVASSLLFVETAPPKLAAGAIAISNTQFNWTLGAGANDIVILIASADPATFDFGTPFQFLLNFTVIGQTVANQAGLGTTSLVIPPGLQGVTFYSQIGTIDDLTSAIAASNITSTTILF